MKKSRLLFGAIFLTLSSVLLIALVLALRAASVNLLSIDDIAGSHGVLREQRLFDGKLPAPGSPINDFVAAIFLTGDAFIQFDLGEVKNLGYVQLNDFNGALSVWASEDGKTYKPLALTKTRANEQSIAHYLPEKNENARYLRLARLQTSSGQAAAFELTVLLDAPATIPLVHELQNPPTYDASVDLELAHLSDVRFAKIGITLIFVPVFLLIRKRRAMFQLSVYCFFFVLAVCAWFLFSNPLKHLHGWEATHYYLGAKYYPELGHTELYNEIARHEVRKGRGQLVAESEIRDLTSYKVFSGEAALHPRFAAYTAFSPARQIEFSKDADQLRRLFRYRHFQKVMGDHGYNATPLFTTIFGGLFEFIPASRAALTGFALADILFVLGGLAAIWLAFGPLSACLAALVLGVGEPWAFTWTGGSIGRYLWFFLLCGGLALIKRNHRLSGTFALCMAGMLRLFPLVFLAGLGSVALYRVVKHEERCARSVLWLLRFSTLQESRIFGSERIAALMECYSQSRSSFARTQRSIQTRDFRMLMTEPPS